MDSSHFYEDSSEDEMPAWDDYSDVSFNPWAKSKRSSLMEADNRSSLTSFLFGNQSPSWQRESLADEVPSPMDDESVRKAPVKVPKGAKIPVQASAPSTRRDEHFHDNSNSLSEGDLQTYMQTLLGGSITEGVHQEMDLYQECLGRRSMQHSRFLSPKPAPSSRERSLYNKDSKRLSVMSNVSDASAVPSLIFSDVDVKARRPSTLSANALPGAATLRRSSIISLNSIDSVASNRSWFMDDESPPQSPVEPTPLKKRVTFTRGVELGMSCFDDGNDDDEDEEEHQEDVVSPESPCFVLMGAETSQKLPNGRRKQHPGLIIQTMPPQNPLNMLSPPLPPLTHSPISPRNSICASPNKRRSRRRTASSECIVLEALEKMNAVMYEFANEDINRKSVVGIDLPGNQVSVEAYGELWW